MLLVEACDRSVYHRAAFLVVTGIRCRCCRLGKRRNSLVAAEEAERVAPAALECVERKVHGDPDQISLERAFLAEPAERSVEAHEGFLSHVIGVIAATN